MAFMVVFLISVLPRSLSPNLCYASFFPSSLLLSTLLSTVLLLTLGSLVVTGRYSWDNHYLWCERFYSHL